jgi:hypothetical protein
VVGLRATHHDGTGGQLAIDVESLGHPCYLSPAGLPWHEHKSRPTTYATGDPRARRPGGFLEQGGRRVASDSATGRRIAGGGGPRSP